MGLYFTFTVISFELSTACYAFTMHIRAVVYVDDGIVAVKEEHNAQHVSTYGNSERPNTFSWFGTSLIQ